MLSDRCLSVCPVCLSVTFVHRGQTVGRIKMKPGMQVGLGPGHIVLDGDPLALPQKGPKFSADVNCGQTAGWMKRVLGMEVGLSPGDCVRWGPSPYPKRGRSPLPNIRPISMVAKRPNASKCHLVCM